MSAQDGETAEPTPEVPPVPLLTLSDGLPAVTAGAAPLAGAVERLAAGTGPLAIDAERASGYRYSQRAYLVQLRRSGAGTFLVDPMPDGDVPNESLEPLSTALADAEWVLHAASQDLPCLQELGMRPAHLFDTELAGRLLNIPRVNLAALVEELLGYRMRKEHSAVDWSRRPLPEPWLEYAALDVEPLAALRDALAERLAEAGKDEWARQEFVHLTDLPPRRARREAWRRTSGIHRVHGRRGLAVVRELWLARDEIAESLDIAPGRILRDAAIVEAAQNPPATQSALLGLSGFANRSGRRHADRLWAAVQRAVATPDGELPTLSPRHDGPPSPRIWATRFPEAAARLNACRAAVAEVAERVEVPAENLLGPDVVRRVAWEPPPTRTASAVARALEDLGAREWQRELTTEALTGALEST